MEVPCYQEISVKNLYEDAMKDELLVKYLPTKEQLSGRLPERDFFFGDRDFFFGDRDFFFGDRDFFFGDRDFFFGEGDLRDDEIGFNGM